MARGSIRRGGYGSRDPIGGSQGGGYAGSSLGHGAGYGSQGYGASHGGQGGGDYGEVRAPGWEVPQRAPRGPKGYRRSDERIREDICERLIREDWIDASEVTVNVENAHVTLEGTVPERRMKHAIEDIADTTPGVDDIENRIRVLAGAT